MSRTVLTFAVSTTRDMRTKGDSMKTKLALTALGLIAFAVTVNAATKAIKSTRVSDYQVLVSCANGSKPKVDDIHGSLILSCEGRVE